MRAEKHFRPRKNQLAFACENKRKRKRGKNISSKVVEPQEQLLNRRQAEGGVALQGDRASGRAKGEKTALGSQVANFIYLKRPEKFHGEAENQNRITTEKKYYAVGTPPVGCPAPSAHFFPLFAFSPLPNHKNETFLIHKRIWSRPLAGTRLVNVKETLRLRPRPLTI